jgi:hypothetical protein
MYRNEYLVGVSMTCDREARSCSISLISWNGGTRFARRDCRFLWTKKCARLHVKSNVSRVRNDRNCKRCTTISSGQRANGGRVLHVSGSSAGFSGAFAALSSFRIRFDAGHSSGEKALLTRLHRGDWRGSDNVVAIECDDDK